MPIDYEKKGRIALVTINRPEARNCLNPADLEELGRTWLKFKEDDEMLVGVVTGAGDKAFCAGADLKTLIPHMNAAKTPILPTIPAFIKNINCYKPVIAAVNGYCVAAGMELLVATDIRVAVEEASFAVSEVKWGLFPGGGLTVRLPRQIPFCWAMEILLTGEPISAQQALQIGLINRVVPLSELMDTCMSIAEILCENGPISIKKIKESTLRSYDLPEEQAYHMDAFLANQVFGTSDANEGPKAFSENRKPRFVEK
jgi:enoyl-CoA hydratase